MSFDRNCVASIEMRVEQRVARFTRDTQTTKKRLISINGFFVKATHD